MIMSAQTLHWGGQSHPGQKSRNEDAWQAVQPAPPLPASLGALFLLADGVSDCADGALAAQSTVRTLAADYYAAPQTWSATQTLQSLLAAQNRWLLAQPHQPLLTTIAALALRGHRYTVASVGDTRVYLLRSGELQQLSVDHNWAQPGWQHVLKRAVGLDAHLVPDFADGELQVGDRFLLACDGIWQPLGDDRLRQLLSDFPDPQAACEALIRNALAAGGDDNATAIVIDIASLPERALADDFASMSALPLPPKLKAGDTLDGLHIDSILHEARGSLLYRVHNAAGEPWLLKTLPPRSEDDELARQSLMIEEWLLARMASHYFPEIGQHSGRNYLYLLIREYEGATLAARRERHEAWSVPAGVQIGLRLLRALGLLHRKNVLHRDIKPENIHLADDGRLRLLDFGAACCPGLTDDGATTQPGTPSFMAPELLAGEPASVQADLYAAGVTLYWLFTGHYPYGEIEPFQRPHFGEPARPTRWRPDLPAWLENLLLKAVARDPAQRFETAEEFVHALEMGERDPVARRHVPLIEREPLKFWQTLALVALVLDLVLLYLLLLTG